jgi:hypothetical protein
LDLLLFPFGALSRNSRQKLPFVVLSRGSNFDDLQPQLGGFSLEMNDLLFAVLCKWIALTFIAGEYIKFREVARIDTYRNDFPAWPPLSNPWCGDIKYRTGLASIANSDA